MLNILRHTPWWVFPLFLYLVLQGVRQLRPRRVSPWSAAIYPLVMLAAALSRNLAAGPAWGPFAYASVAGSVLGLLASMLASYPRGIALDETTGEVLIPGSPWPLILMLLVFALRFAMGALQARAPALAASWPMQAGSGLVLGLLGGIFLSRLVARLRLLRLSRTRSLPATHPA